MSPLKCMHVNPKINGYKSLYLNVYQMMMMIKLIFHPHLIRGIFFQMMIVVFNLLFKNFSLISAQTTCFLTVLSMTRSMGMRNMEPG